MTTFSGLGTALVTGASSGIGADYARRLAERGYDLILVARNHQRLNHLAKHISDETGRAVEILDADLTVAKDVARIENVIRHDASLTLLVNNAGIGATQPLAEASLNEMVDMIALNVTAVTRLTHAAVPGFVSRGFGTIVNIASIVAIAPELLNGVYGGSKAFVLAFSQSLHHELADKGIRVQAVLPGATSTDFWNVAGLPVDELKKSVPVMTSLDMVDAALAGLDSGELVTLPALPDIADWEAFEAARQRLIPQLSSTTPARRYRVPAVRAVKH